MCLIVEEINILEIRQEKKKKEMIWIFSSDDNWIAYGLNVLVIYENDDWIKIDGNENEWAVAYHGTKCYAIKIICQKNAYSSCQGMKDWKFWSSSVEGATAQVCSNNKNLNPFSQAKYEVCGEGAYCSPHLSYANGYSDGTIIMCRVNLKKMRIPQGYEENEWITNGSSDEIRPCRILIKKS